MDMQHTVNRVNNNANYKSIKDRKQNITIT